MADFVLSSTRLATFLLCPRKWWYLYVRGDGLEETYPMALGTVFHAAMEWRIRYGFIPSRHDVRSMEGNYEDPSVSMDRFPDAWDEARVMVEAQDTPRQDAEVEVPVEDFGLRIGGIPVTGYFDMLIRDEQRLDDWKTRSRLDYIPRTPGDFHRNPQLAYYAACARQHFGWDTVTVCHRNVLRPSKGGPKRVDISVELEGWFLDRFWSKLEDDIVPRMKRVAKRAEHDVDRNDNACYKYGPCEFIDGCSDSDSFFGDLEDVEPMEILSPQAPANEEPVPYEKKPIDKLNPDATVKRSMDDAGIQTLGDLDAWLEGHDWQDLTGVGPATEEDLVEVHSRLKQGVLP